MDDLFFYDSPSSIAAKCKREQFLTEAREHNLRHQLDISQKQEKLEEEKILAEPWIFSPNTDENPSAANI